MPTYAKRSTATATGTSAGAVDGGTLSIEGGAHIHGLIGIIGSGVPTSEKTIHANMVITSADFHDFEPCELPMPISGAQLGGFLCTPAEQPFIMPVDINVPSVGAVFNMDINIIQPPGTAGKFQIGVLYDLGGISTSGKPPKHYGECNVTGPTTAGTKTTATEKLLADAKRITDLWFMVSLLTPTDNQDAQYICDLSGDTKNLGPQEFICNQFAGSEATNAAQESEWLHYKVDIPVVGGMTLSAKFDCLTTITGTCKAQLIIGYE